MPNPQVIEHADKSELAASTGSRILAVINDAIENNGIAHLSLTGGTMGIAVWSAIAESGQARTIDWSKVHFWWSDERFVETGHADRNEKQAKDALLDSLEIPAENLHIMGASDVFDSVDKAAEAYTAELKKFAPEGQASPAFDLGLLGLGPDGHIASLFPDREEIHLSTFDSLAVRNSPKPPPTRVSMSLPVINRARKIWFLIAGSDKQDATARLRQAAELSDDQLTAEILTATPGAGARGTEETLILATQDAL